MDKRDLYDSFGEMEQQMQQMLDKMAKLRADMTTVLEKTRNWSLKMNIYVNTWSKLKMNCRKKRLARPRSQSHGKTWKNSMMRASTSATSFTANGVTMTNPAFFVWKSFMVNVNAHSRKSLGVVPDFCAFHHESLIGTSHGREDC